MKRPEVLRGWLVITIIWEPTYKNIIIKTAVEGLATYEYEIAASQRWSYEARSSTGRSMSNKEVTPIYYYLCNLKENLEWPIFTIFLQFFGPHISTRPLQF